MRESNKARGPPASEARPTVAISTKHKPTGRLIDMNEKIEKDLLDETFSHIERPHENQEIKVDNLHSPLGEVPQNGDKPSTSSPIAEVDWDLNALRLDQNFDTIIGAKPVLGVVKVRKPNNQEWFRIHPSEDWRLQTAVLHLKEEGENYLVHHNLRVAIWDEIQPVMLFTAINRQGEVFVWPVRLPKGDGRTDTFMQSDMKAAKEAEDKWTRRQWVPENKSHKVSTANGLTDFPVWPDTTFQKLIETAFQDKFIRDLDHPILRRLRGEE